MAKPTKLTQRGIGDLQRSSERFETYNDGFIMPDSLIVVRLDAHRFGDWSAFADEYPTGPAATKALLLTARALMSSTFRVVLSYVHGDEISLVVDPTENANPLRRSKLISAFSSAAAVHFLKASGFSALFDAKISELPSDERLVEYLFWQRRYCFRNASTIALRKALTRAGHTTAQADAKIQNTTEEERLAQLASLGTPVETIPHTTRRGSLLYWDTPQDGGTTTLAKVVVDTRLSDDDETYEAYIRQRVMKALNKSENKSRSSHPVEHARPSPVVPKTKTHEKPQAPPNHQPRQSKPPKTKKAQVSVFRVPPTR